RCKTTGGDRRTGCRCPVEGCAVCRLTSRERSEQAGGGSRSFDDVVRSDINRALNRAAARGLEGFAVLGEVQVADLQLAVGNAIQRFLVAEGDGSARLAGNHAVHVVATRSTAKHHANAARCLVNYTGAGADKR